VFLFDCLKTGIGLSAPRALCDVGGIHYFMGQNDIYRWNGGQPESIGVGVRDFIFDTLDRQYIDRCFALNVSEYNEVWFFTVTSGVTWPIDIWKFNYQLGFWYHDTCASLTGGISWNRTATENWDDENGSWDEATDTWDSGTVTQSAEEIVFGDSSGYCYNLNRQTSDDNSVAVSSEFQTKDFSGDQLEIYKRWLQLNLWVRGSGTFKVYYSVDYGSSWKSISTVTMSDTYTQHRCYFDVVSEVIRFKLICEGSGNTFYLRNIYPYYMVREEVR